MPDSDLARGLMLALVALELGAVLYLFQMLRANPAPPLALLSLRRAAHRLLRPTSSRERRRNHLEVAKRRAITVRGLAFVAAVGLLWLPVDVGWGPLDSKDDTEQYLGTLWQVVAAALALSLVMIAFAFEAFSSSREGTYGNLREFAQDSRLIYVVELGVFSLFLDGLVLFGGVGDAPAGWPALCAILTSAATLAGVVIVVHRVLRVMDDRELLRMRRRRLMVLVEEAMRRQLLGQAGEIVVRQSALPLKHTPLPMPNTRHVPATSSGCVTDVHLGRLARRVVRARGRHPGLELELHVSIGERVTTQTTVLSVRGASDDRLLRRLGRTVVIDSRGAEPSDAGLMQLLTRLHGQAMDAARAGREEEWREVGSVYEQVLLGLPRAAARWGVPFEGAVAAPGFFGQGPLQRIRDFLYEELRAAVDNNSRELIDPISYLPYGIAVEATPLGAPAVAAAMLSLYPAMYALATER